MQTYSVTLMLQNGPIISRLNLVMTFPVVLFWISTNAAALQAVGQPDPSLGYWYRHDKLISAVICINCEWL